MITFHSCTMCEVQNADNTITFKLGSDDKACKVYATRMWANAQPDGRPAERSWRPLFNAAKFG